MVNISRDIGCFMLALFYVEILWVIFIIKCDFLSEREGVHPPSVVFCTPPLFNSSLCSWSEIVSFVRKCKNLASMVIISRDIRCFMLALFYVEMWWVIFNIKCDFLSEWEELPLTLNVFLYTSPFQFFLELN